VASWTDDSSAPGYLLAGSKAKNHYDPQYCTKWKEWAWTTSSSEKPLVLGVSQLINLYNLLDMTLCQYLNAG
jgi:hypothetical protein